MRYLSTWIPWHNGRFAVLPASSGDAYVCCPVDETELARICAIHHRRKLSKDLVLSFRQQRYIIQTGGKPRYVVTVIEYSDRRIELLHSAETLPFKVFDETRNITVAVDDKTLNTRVEELLKRRYPCLQSHSSTIPGGNILSQLRHYPITPGQVKGTFISCSINEHFYWILALFVRFGSKLHLLRQTGCGIIVHIRHHLSAIRGACRSQRSRLFAAPRCDPPFRWWTGGAR